ncbi:MAG: hypothetical protein OEQ39_03005 [Gammaproteobacteria bacterium]|nr:hypothetical protein [Gammaproteobacteria bacterium]MDH3375919.1 hypothetical protein [Gammaproteobacteria bacterium]
MRTVEDEILELLRKALAVELEIEVIVADDLKPRKEELKYLRDRIKALMTSESREQALFELAEKDAVVAGV